MTPDTAQTKNSEELPPVVPNDSPASPGAIIRSARERAHLSIDELAAQTKLARHTLEALERDDFKSLLEPVYVRGYYRKCAKVLELPDRELIEAYQSRVEPRSPAAPSKLRLASGTELGSGSRLPIALAIFVAIVAIVVCGFLWFWRNNSESLPAPPAPAAVEAQPAPSAAEAALPQTDSPILPAVTESPTAETPPPPATATTTTAPTTAPPPAGAPAGATGTVTVTLNQTSWLRVDDASGKSLHNAIANAGEVKSFTGTPPLTVFLGNAPGVTVEFDGKPVDFTKWRRGNNTAKFTLPLAP
jgi:cytoskeleton protein RodZ